MLKVDVAGAPYEICNTWNDLTLARFGELITVEMPDKLKSRWLALLKQDNALYEELEKQVTYKEIVKIFPVYYGKILQFCSDIPAEVIERIDWKLRERLFNEYLIHFAITSIADLPVDRNGELSFYEPQMIENFEFNGSKYFLPVSLDRGGRVTPLAKESILTFSEAADIEIALNEWKTKGIEAMAQVAAVYCLMDGEQHSDELVIKRTEEFKELPMDVIWEVFFCIVSLGLRLQSGLETYLKDLLKQKSGKRRRKRVSQPSV